MYFMALVKDMVLTFFYLATSPTAEIMFKNIFIVTFYFYHPGFCFENCACFLFWQFNQIFFSDLIKYSLVLPGLTDIGTKSTKFKFKFYSAASPTAEIH